MAAAFATGVIIGYLRRRGQSKRLDHEDHEENEEHEECKEQEKEAGPNHPRASLRVLRSSSCSPWFNPCLYDLFPQKQHSFTLRTRRTRRKAKSESLFAAFLRALRVFVVNRLIVLAGELAV
jgi:hypothetical protein